MKYKGAFEVWTSDLQAVHILKLRLFERQALVDVKSQPILDSHVPVPHAVPHRRRGLAAILVNIVYGLKIVLYITRSCLFTVCKEPFPLVSESQV